MITEKFSGEVTQAYGKALPSPVKFNGEYEKYESMDEARSKNDVLSDEEQLNVINAKRKAAERAKATTAALEAAGIAKPDPNSPEVIRAQNIKLLMKMFNVDEATATQLQKNTEAAAAALVG